MEKLREAIIQWLIGKALATIAAGAKNAKADASALERIIPEWPRCLPYHIGPTQADIAQTLITQTRQFHALVAQLMPTPQFHDHVG
jgi:hypothetical protein